MRPLGGSPNGSGRLWPWTRTTPVLMRLFRWVTLATAGASAGFLVLYSLILYKVKPRDACCIYPNVMFRFRSFNALCDRLEGMLSTEKDNVHPRMHTVSPLQWMRPC